MAAPELRMGARGKWTPASLRDRYRYQIAQIPSDAQYAAAYALLSQMALDGGWGTAQMRAVAEGLELGIEDAS